MKVREMVREKSSVGVLGAVQLCEVSQGATREAQSLLLKNSLPRSVNSLKFHQFFILITLCGPADSVPICPLKYSLKSFAL